MSSSSQRDPKYDRNSCPTEHNDLLKPEAWCRKRYSFGSNRRSSPETDLPSSRDSSRKSCSSKRSSSSRRRNSFLLSLKSVLPWSDHGLLSPPASPKGHKHKYEIRPPPQHYSTGEIKPLPPFPIVDSEAIIPQQTDHMGTSFRTAYGRKYHLCTGKYIVHRIS
jgi:hypothetical protein